jgi:excisionase family DNA binding protein
MLKTHATARRWATPTQAAQYLGVTSRTLRAMIADGRIVGYKSSSRLIRIDLNEIDAQMQPFGGAV